MFIPSLEQKIFQMKKIQKDWCSVLEEGGLVLFIVLFFIADPLKLVRKLTMKYYFTLIEITFKSYFPH